MNGYKDAKTCTKTTPHTRGCFCGGGVVECVRVHTYRYGGCDVVCG